MLEGYVGYVLLSFDFFGGLKLMFWVFLGIRFVSLNVVFCIGIFEFFDLEMVLMICNEDDFEILGVICFNFMLVMVFDGIMYGVYLDDLVFCGWLLSMVDFIILYMFLIDYNRVYDFYVDDYFYVLCFIIE